MNTVFIDEAGWLLWWSGRSRASWCTCREAAASASERLQAMERIIDAAMHFCVCRACRVSSHSTTKKGAIAALISQFTNFASNQPPRHLLHFHQLFLHLSLDHHPSQTTCLVSNDTSSNHNPASRQHFPWLHVSNMQKSGQESSREQQKLGQVVQWSERRSANP
jgi:hypothetical protein